MALDIGVFLDSVKNLFKAKVSSNDTQPDYLINKFTSSDASVTITETNDGGVEQINLQSSGGGGGSNISNSTLTFDNSYTHDLAGYNVTLDDAANTSKFSMTVPNIGSGNREIFTIQDRAANSGYFFSKGGTQFEFTIKTAGTNKIKLNGNGNGSLAVGTSGFLGGGSSDQAYLLNDHLTLGGTNSSFNGRFGVRGLSMFTGTTSGAFSETALATVHVRGVGSSDATTALLVENSSGNASLQIDDAGSVWNTGGGAVASNTVFGLNAIPTGTGSFNTVFGYEALQNATTAASSVAIGYQALNTITFGNSNVAIGRQAGFSVFGGENNVLIGYRAGYNITSGDNHIAIGNLTAASVTSASHGISIGRNADGNGEASIAIGYLAATSTNYSAIINTSRASRTNSTANSLAVHLDNVGTDATFFIGQSSDSYYSGSGNFGVGTTSPDIELDVNGSIGITDGVTAPTSVVGKAFIYVDSADGDLKIVFGDGTVKTIVTDS
jgi:hypothetical protein